MTQERGPTPPLTVQPTSSPPAAPSKLGGGKMVLIILALVALCGVPLVGIVAALSIYGVKKYITNAKAGEGSHETQLLASGIARCAAELDPATGRARGLPATSPAVPGSLGPIRGVKYESSASEWSAPAFSCAGFRVVGPQYFQYQWEKRSPTTGAALAIGDLNGDGAPDVTFEAPVTCPAVGACSVGVLEKREL